MLVLAPFPQNIRSCSLFSYIYHTMLQHKNIFPLNTS